MELLNIRKRVIPLTVEALRSELGRDPRVDEIEKRVRPYVQDRGWQLAVKGDRTSESVNFESDEEILVQAVVSAITTGRETSVLTRDRDLTEQFYKLMYLIDMGQ